MIDIPLEAATKAANEMARNMSVPIYTHKFEDGSEVNITPAAIIAVGGMAALVAVAYLLTAAYDEITEFTDTNGLGFSLETGVKNTLPGFIANKFGWV